MSDEHYYPDDARAVKLLNDLMSDGRALRPPNHPNKVMISARISDVAHQGLQNIAKELGYVHGGKGNVSMLLEAVGTRTLKVTQEPLRPRHL